jgi:uridine kinase
MPVGSFADLALAVRARAPRADSTRVVGIDGPAGSGKSVFAARLAKVLEAEIICLDDLTPSWTGPDREARLLVEQVLAPLAAGRPARYQFYDWAKERYTEFREIPPVPFLVVEGVGAGSRLARPYLSYVVWVEAPSAIRLERGLERDGVERRAEWERWRTREDALFEREGTRAAADLRVDGAPSIPHDAAVEYVNVRHSGEDE